MIYTNLIVCSGVYPSFCDNKPNQHQLNDLGIIEEIPDDERIETITFLDTIIDSIEAPPSILDKELFNVK